MEKISRTRLIKIGNSRGIRIPKVFIEQLDLESAVELVVQQDHLEIRSGKRPRVGWGEQFQAMAKRGDDKLIDEVGITAWDEDDWEW